MYGHAMAAIGAMLLFLLGAGGCMSRADEPMVSAMVRAHDLRAQAHHARVAVDLGQIVNP
jgi:hypothetical protein